MNPRMREPSRHIGAGNGQRLTLMCLGLVCLFAGAAPAQSPAVLPATALPASAHIRFRCSSTLHDFEGQVSAQPFVLTLATNTWSAKGAVLAGEMTTDHKSRDRKMWDMLAASIHLQITGEVAPSPLPPPTGTNVTLLLRIRDQQHELPVRITGWTETAEEVQFQAAWEVSLKQYGLKPPSVIGMVRVGDRVQLDARITARKVRDETPAPAVRPDPNPSS